MKNFLLPSLFFALSFTLPGTSHANDFDFSSLKVTSGVNAGLWSRATTTMPKHPHIKNKQEQGCMSKAELTQMMNTALDASQKPCKIEVQADFSDKAQLLMHCPKIVLPSIAGAPPINAPAADIPMTIQKMAGIEKWTVDVQMPEVPGAMPSAIWRSEYTRLGACRR